MKLHLPHKLFAALMTILMVPAVTAASPEEGPGSMMCVGDSISHGTGTYSYRWYLHKIFVDNGLDYEAAGYHTGSWNYDFNTVYGDADTPVYTNTHSARYNAKTGEFLSTSFDNRGQLGNTLLTDWLGITTNSNYSTSNTLDSRMTGNVYKAGTENAVDTFTLMLGTNDLNQQNYSAAGILGNVATMVGYMQQDNPSAQVYVFSVPVFSNDTQFSTIKGRRAAVAEYNSSLEKWANGEAVSMNFSGASAAGNQAVAESVNTDNVTYVDINKGLRDVTYNGAHTAVKSMTSSDGVHLTPQADLLIAGNAAKAMGYAGATAGLERKGLAPVDTPAPALTVGSATTYAWDAAPELGYTAEFNFSVGNGATGGWNTTDQLSVTLGNDSFYGTLNINEAYIKWGTTILYSYDMSTVQDTLRVAFTTGNEEQGVAAGYYVWLGDQMIGEGLGYTFGAGHSGLSFSVTANSYATVSGIGMDSTEAYAPTPTLTSHSDTGFHLTQTTVLPEAAPGTIAPVEGADMQDWGTVGGGNVAIVWSPRGAAQATDTAIRATVVFNPTGTNNSTNAYANFINGSGGNKDRDVEIIVTSTSGKMATFYGHGTSGVTDEVGTLNGSVVLRLTGSSSGAVGVYGINGGVVKGDVGIELSAEGANYGTTVADNAVIAGASTTGGTIEGTYRLQVNNGTVNGSVYGGAAGTTGSFGRVEMFINGGTLKQYIFGGNNGGGGIGEGVLLSLNGGTVVKNIFGGNRTGGTIDGGVEIRFDGTAAGMEVFGGNYNGGTINGGVEMTFNKGAFTGAVYGGNYQNASSTINGGVEMTVNGGTFNGLLAGGNRDGGTITGGVAMTINSGTFNGMVVGGSNNGGSITAAEGAPAIDMTIVGGTFSKFVLAGGAKGDVTGDVHLTISGGDFTAMNGQSRTQGGIYVGKGSGTGTLTGATVVTLKDIANGNKFTEYTGILSGQHQTDTNTGITSSTLCLDHYTADAVNANIQGFTALSAVNGTKTRLSSLGGASKVEVDATSDVTLQSSTGTCQAAISVSDGGSLTFGDSAGEHVTITAQEGKTAGIDSGVEFNTTNGAISGSGTLADAKLTINSQTERTLSSTLVFKNTSVTSTGAAVNMAVQAGSSFAELDVQSDMTLTGAGDSLAVEKLNLSEGQTFSAFKGEATDTPVTADEVTISLKELVVEGDATVNANLVFGDAEGTTYSLVMKGTVDMGSSLSLYSGGTITLNDDAVYQVLFTGVDELYLNGEHVEEAGRISASALFTNAEENSTIFYARKEDGWKVSYLGNIPEPGTATLSLLALAALAARRRRK